MYIIVLIIIGSVFTTAVDDSPLSHCMGTVVESHKNYVDAVAFCNAVVEE
tara:strand:- start:274 stop:423 length:150 start_codon:yes stop_codon:yes gene_type:complete